MAYARLYRRAAPRSARSRPTLTPEPVSRRYGQDRGRPVDRVYIERFLAEHATDVRGRVLEIYEPTYTERFGGGRVDRSDVLDAAPDAPRATIVGDLQTGAGLPDAAFDCFICTQTLSLVADPAAALVQAHRALAPGGVLLATVPGISHRPRAGGDDFPDLWRFTAAGLARLAQASFADVEVRAWGNVRTAAAFLYGLAEEDLPADAFTADDPEYEVLIALRAVRR